MADGIGISDEVFARARRYTPPRVPPKGSPQMPPILPTRPAARFRPALVWSVVWFLLVYLAVVHRYRPDRTRYVLLAGAVVVTSFAVRFRVGQAFSIRSIVETGNALPLRLSPRQAAEVWRCSGRATVDGPAWQRPVRPAATGMAVVGVALIGAANVYRGQMLVVVLMSVVSILCSVTALGSELSVLPIALLMRHWEKRYSVAIFTIWGGAPVAKKRPGIAVLVDRAYVNSWSEARALLKEGPNPKRGRHRMGHRRPDPSVGEELGPYLQ